VETMGYGLGSCLMVTGEYLQTHHPEWCTEMICHEAVEKAQMQYNKLLGLQHHCSRQLSVVHVTADNGWQ
jgi:hypothetical protein